MTKPRRNTDKASASSANVASRVEVLEANLQAELKDLKEQLLGTQESARTPEVVSLYLKKINEFQNKVMEAIKGVREEVEKVDRDVLEQKQQHTINTLVFNGIPEKDGASDYEEIRKVVKNYLKIDINMADVDFCYRLGRKGGTDGQIRPVAVRFVNRWFRDKIFGEKKKLKGSKIVISEFLISGTLSLYKKVRDKVGTGNCWTWRGGIYAFVNENKIKIRSLFDLQGLM